MEHWSMRVALIQNLHADHEGNLRAIEIAPNHFFLAGDLKDRDVVTVVAVAEPVGDDCVAIGQALGPYALGIGLAEGAGFGHED